MLLTVSKKFEFSASHRYIVSHWSAEKNQQVFGKQSEGSYGHGHNFEAYFVFSGEPDERSGMLINVATIKGRILPLLEQRYDHHFLNEDTPPFDTIQPTPENIAGQLLKESRELFSNHETHPVACHLVESPETSVTAYADGKIERILSLSFSAARRTYSPHLSDDENSELFGIASHPSGHGHHYHLRLTLSGQVDSELGMIYPECDSDRIIAELSEELDHRNLNEALSALKGQPMTTETIAGYLWNKLDNKLPLRSLRLQENENFSVERDRNGNCLMNIGGRFSACHRLHSDKLSESKNNELFGKCNNPSGHGHLYRVECSIAGQPDMRSGTIANLTEIDEMLKESVSSWEHRHLDLETNDFAGIPSTGENIVAVLWKKLEAGLGEKLHRLRLWETPNNRFTLRREYET